MADAAGRPDAAPEVLYVHPWGHLNDLVVPVGALSALNALDVPKLGRYAFEVRDTEIRAARVVALDLHWALGLGGLAPLVRHIRAVNPAARIVVGGATASFYRMALLERLGVDFVVEGDAEVAFPALVHALLGDGEPPALPNVHRRGQPAPGGERLPPGRFDATDGLTTDWFPTLHRIAPWGFAAYPAGPTLSVARGCPMACPNCYGEIAGTLGEGWHLLSPGATAAAFQRAAARQPRTFLAFFGRLPPQRLHALLAAIGDTGPHPFPENVDLYLCTPPRPADLRPLLDAIPARITLSVIHPADRRPAPSPSAVGAEMDAWRAVAGVATTTDRLDLVVWVGSEARRRQAAGQLGTPSPRVQVKHDVSWDITRPRRVRGGRDLPEVTEAVAPIWTFYAARLLSPALAVLMAPFGLLDDLEDDPAPRLPRRTGLETFREVLLERWRAHRLPALPGLAFTAVPLRLEAPPPAPRIGPGGVHHLGALSVFPVSLEALARHRARDLETDLGADGVTLHGPPVGLGPDEALAFVPRLGDAPLDDEGLAALAAEGLTTLRPGRGGDLRPVLALRAQQVTGVLLDARGAARARGVAHLDYVRPDTGSPAFPVAPATDPA